MSEIVSAGKRGRVWECCLCNFRGERHYLLRHMYSKHLTFDEWPYRCPVCGYSHYDYNNFKEHPQWYSLNSALKGSSSVLLPTSADIREESKVVFTMICQLTLGDSDAHWERKRRVNTLAQFRPPAPVALRTILPSSFPPSGAPATKPV
ncbi:uncharacterized protein LOC134260077 [Saccostrea cucullata]|uniref:uncharacterized protein LOC134260077 n=1 Tax=Saccostrea cuccullata TaxID=36930 RepID=UPI002ED41D08